MVVDELADSDVDRIFHALADATRRDILAQVIRQERSVSTLAQLYPMSFAAVQKHVAVLERAALITKHKQGREQIVHANPAELAKATRLRDAFEKLWRHRADRIEQLLTED